MDADPTLIDLLTSGLTILSKAPMEAPAPGCKFCWHDAPVKNKLLCSEVEMPMLAGLPPLKAHRHRCPAPAGKSDPCTAYNAQHVQ